MLAGMCKNPQVDIDGPAGAELVAERRGGGEPPAAAAVSEVVYEVILREIPEIRDDKSVLTLPAARTRRRHRCRCLSLRFLIRLPQVAMSHQAPARLWERS